MTELLDERAAWPRKGEIWIPVLPWPEHECPAGLYVHGLNSGWAPAVEGAPFAYIGIGEYRDPVSRRRAVLETWELRYGGGQVKKELIEARVGMLPVTVEVVGATWAWVVLSGRRERMPVRDLLLGFRRVEYVTLVEHDDLGEWRRTRVDGSTANDLIGGIAAAVAPMLALDMKPSDPEAIEAAVTLVTVGRLIFEGDSPIYLEWGV